MQKFSLLFVLVLLPGCFKKDSSEPPEVDVKVAAAAVTGSRSGDTFSKHPMCPKMSADLESSKTIEEAIGVFQRCLTGGAWDVEATKALSVRVLKFSGGSFTDAQSAHIERLSEACKKRVHDNGEIGGTMLQAMLAVCETEGFGTLP